MWWGDVEWVQVGSGVVAGSLSVSASRMAVMGRHIPGAGAGGVMGRLTEMLSSPSPWRWASTSRAAVRPAAIPAVSARRLVSATVSNRRDTPPRCGLGRYNMNIDPFVITDRRRT